MYTSYYGMNSNPFLKETNTKYAYQSEDYNQIINRYGINLKIISLPGHTNGSIGIQYKNYLFAGDALVYRKKHPEIAYQNQDNKEAIRSYNKILDLSPEMIFIGHDKAISIDKLINI